MFLVYKLACRVDNSLFYIVKVLSLIWVQLSCLPLLFMYDMNCVSTFLSHLTKPRCSTAVLPQQKLVVTAASKAAIKINLNCIVNRIELPWQGVYLELPAWSLEPFPRCRHFIALLCSYYIAPLCVSSLRSKTWLIPTLLDSDGGRPKDYFFSLKATKLTDEWTCYVDVVEAHLDWPGLMPSFNPVPAGLSILYLGERAAQDCFWPAVSAAQPKREKAGIVYLQNQFIYLVLKV